MLFITFTKFINQAFNYISVVLCLAMLLTTVVVFANDPVLVELEGKNGATAEYVTDCSYDKYVNKLQYENGLVDLTDLMYDANLAGEHDVSLAAFDGSEGTLYQVSGSGFFRWRFRDNYFPAEGEISDIIIKVSGNMGREALSNIGFSMRIVDSKNATVIDNYGIVNIGSVNDTSGVIHVKMPKEFADNYNGYIMYFNAFNLDPSNWRDSSNVNGTFQFADFTILGHKPTDVVKGLTATVVGGGNPQYGYENNGGWVSKGTACLTNGSYWSNSGFYANQQPGFKFDLGDKKLITDVQLYNASAVSGFTSGPAQLLGTEFYASNDPDINWTNRKEKGVCIGKVDTNNGGAHSLWKESTDGGTEKPDGNSYRYIVFGRDLGDYDGDTNNDKFEISGVKIIDGTLASSEVTSLSATNNKYTFEIPVTNKGLDNDLISGYTDARSAKKYKLVVCAYDVNGDLIKCEMTSAQIGVNTTTTIKSDEFTAPDGTARVSAFLINADGKDLRLISNAVNLVPAN